LRFKKQGDAELQVLKPQQPELIVVATAPAEFSELAGFARTCEVCMFYALPRSQPTVMQIDVFSDPISALGVNVCKR